MRRCAARQMMSKPKHGWLVRWPLMLPLMLLAEMPFAQGAPWIVREVHGYRIALAVESVFESAQPGTDPRHARVLEHRLRVSIHEETTGRAAPIASVTADVAEAGYAGATIALWPANSRERGLFEGRMRLSTDPPHRILVHATPAGGGRTLEAQYEYRHHH
jgi:hypothetical protein